MWDTERLRDKQTEQKKVNDRIPIRTEEKDGNDRTEVEEEKTDRKKRLRRERQGG